MVVKLKFERLGFDRSLHCILIDTRLHDIVFFGDVGKTNDYLRKNNFTYLVGTNGLWAKQGE